MAEAYLVGFGSSAQGGSASELALDAVRIGIADAGLELGDVDRLILTAAVPSTPAELSLASTVARTLGIGPVAFGVAFGEASGLFAIAHAAHTIATGMAQVAVAGGADTPSRVPYWVPGLRTGAAAQAGTVIDPLPTARFDPATTSAVDGGDRAAHDAFALRSHERAGTQGRSLDALAALKPIHSPEGTITVGNSAAHLDGAAVAVLSDQPSEITVAGSALVGNTGTGNVAGALATAIRITVADTALSDLTAIELHESSAALCFATAEHLGIDPTMLNRQGGEIDTGSAGAASGVLMVERAYRQLIVAPAPGRAVVAAGGPEGQAIALALARQT